MKAQHELMISQKHALTLFAVAAAALLAIVATIPAVQATSLAPGIMPEVDDDSTSSSVVSAALSRDEITFLEDNWYFDSGALQPGENQESDDAGSSVLTRDAMQFMEDNLVLGIGHASSNELAQDEDVTLPGPRPDDPFAFDY